MSQDIKEPITHCSPTMESYKEAEIGMFRQKEIKDMLFKPKSTWFSLNHDWERWCKSENFGDIDNMIISDVKLKDGLTFLKIETVVDAKELGRFLGLREKTHRDKLFQDGEFTVHEADMMAFTQYMIWEIGEMSKGRTHEYIWNKVISRYDGIYYKNSWELHSETFFNAWDVDCLAIFVPETRVTLSNPRLGKQVIDINHAQEAN